MPLFRLCCKALHVVQAVVANFPLDGSLHQALNTVCKVQFLGFEFHIKLCQQEVQGDPNFLSRDSYRPNSSLPQSWTWAALFLQPYTYIKIPCVFYCQPMLRICMLKILPVVYGSYRQSYKYKWLLIVLVIHIQQTGIWDFRWRGCCVCSWAQRKRWCHSLVICHAAPILLTIFTSDKVS